MKARPILFIATWMAFNLAVSGLAQSPNTNAATLSAGVVRGFPGRTANVPLSLRHTGAVSGLQFDLTYPSNKWTAGLFGGGALAERAVLRSRQLGPGTHRVLMYTRDRSLLATNTAIGALPLAVPNTGFDGGAAVRITNAMISKPDGFAASPARASDGGVVFSPVFFPEINGTAYVWLSAESNRTYVVQASDDLRFWVNISTNFAVYDYIAISDPDAAGKAMRFYRLVAEGTPETRTIYALHLQPGGALTFGYPAIAGLPYIVQTSTNLTAWVSLTTNIANGPRVNITNLISPSDPLRFFRILEPP